MFKKSKLDKIYYPNVFKRLEANIVDSIVIIISLFLTLTCLIVNNFTGRLSNQVNRIEFINTDSKTLTVSTKQYEDILDNSNVNSISNIWKCKSYNYFVESNFGTMNVGRKHFSVDVLSVGFFDKKMILPSFDQFGATEKVSLIEGSLPTFSEKTEDDYIYLYNSFKTFIFDSSTDVIGEKMQFYFDNSYHTFKIAGILSDSLDVLRALDKIDKVHPRSDSSIYSFPLVHASKNLNKISKMLLFMDNEILSSNLDTMRTQLSNSIYRELQITSMNEQLETKSLFIQVNDNIVRTILNIVTIFLAGISVLLIFLFMKKRKKEIGIRKSLGASIIDLVVMFLNEVIFCFFLSCLYAIPISSFIMLLISLNVKKSVFLFLYPVNLSIYVIPISLIFLIILFSTTFIITYFSSKKVSNCLKEQ